MISKNNILVLNTPLHPVKKTLFLGYDQSKTKIINALISAGCEVHHTQDPLNAKDLRHRYDFIVSFGYRHILKKEIIQAAGCPIFNLHISYLPYNKGAHPNFWSFYENTPSGVTIHLIDEGIDTGPIVFQKYVNFEESEITFSQTHKRLVGEIENLFISKLDALLTDQWKAKPQRGKGTLHFLKDLPQNFSGWDSIIDDEILRLDEMMESKNER